ncbi:hypothetical protein HOY80DRAFT_965643 [Tuber brumale]|nr:hypothetical protein HOY80DRAFT_965643 [Tuber brumale]
MHAQLIRLRVGFSLPFTILPSLPFPYLTSHRIHTHSLSCVIRFPMIHSTHTVPLYPSYSLLIHQALYTDGIYPNFSPSLLFSFLPSFVVSYCIVSYMVWNTYIPTYLPTYLPASPHP